MAKKWRGYWNNWIAPFHGCPQCGTSLNWQQTGDVYDEPWLEARCGCVSNDGDPRGGLVFYARLRWESKPVSALSVRAEGGKE